MKRAPSPTPASTTRKQSRTMRSSSSTRKVTWGCCLVVVRSTHHIGSFTWPHWARQSLQSYATLGFCLIQGNPQIPGARNTSSISVLIIVSVGLKLTRGGLKAWAVAASYGVVDVRVEDVVATAVAGLAAAVFARAICCERIEVLFDNRSLLLLLLLLYFMFVLVFSFVPPKLGAPVVSFCEKLQ